MCKGERENVKVDWMRKKGLKIYENSKFEMMKARGERKGLENWGEFKTVNML